MACRGHHDVVLENVALRTHLALNKDAPDGRPASAAAGALIVTPEVGGLHHRYDRQAA